MDKRYKCKSCGWTGLSAELDHEIVEGCGGDDKLEVCPTCGSEQVYIDFMNK